MTAAEAARLRAGDRAWFLPFAAGALPAWDGEAPLVVWGRVTDAADAAGRVEVDGIRRPARAVFATPRAAWEAICALAAQQAAARPHAAPALAGVAARAVEELVRLDRAAAAAAATPAS